MKVFISWSGDQSKKVALALEKWLPCVFQNINVWMSEKDIQAGTSWGTELGKTLKECQIGIICLTPDNLKSSWMLFEAGALSTAMDNSRVIPYRFQLKSTDVGPPLAQFQGVNADQDGTFKLLSSINEINDTRLDAILLDKSFKKWWDDLKNDLAAAKNTVSEKIRSDRELLEEILELERQEGIHDFSMRLMQILTSTNVIRIEVAPKEINGKETRIIALRITVIRKIPKEELSNAEMIPEMIFGMPTDVVEEPGNRGAI